MTQVRALEWFRDYSNGRSDVGQALSGLRDVYLEPLFKLHTGYHRKELLPFPPQGYRFIAPASPQEEFFQGISKYPFSRRMLELSTSNLPTLLMKSLIDTKLRRPPARSVLTYSCHHLIFRKEPWILESGRVWDVIGYNLHQYWKLQEFIERSFASRYCKRILFFTEFARNVCLASLRNRDIASKVGVLPRAVHPKRHAVARSDGTIRILFVGSANLAGEFLLRGGHEALEVFARTTNSFDNVQLIVRSDVPPHLRRKYVHLIKQRKIVIIDRVLPPEDLESLYLSSDIFFFPSHYESWQIILEASSYGLPVLSVDLEGTSEVVLEGKTGYLVSESEFIPQSIRGVPIPTLSHAVVSAIRRGPYEPQIAELYERLVRLIGEERLRRRMGERGRAEVETGRFSIVERNIKLKKYFDDAIAS